MVWFDVKSYSQDKEINATIAKKDFKEFLLLCKNLFISYQMVKSVLK